MKDTGMTLLGMKVYESDDIETPEIVFANRQRVSVEVRAEFAANGKVRFVANVRDEPSK